MNPIFIMWVVVLLLILSVKGYFIIRFWNQFFKAFKTDYTFGNKETISLLKQLDKGQFLSVEGQLEGLKTDQLSHTIDCIAYAMSEHQLLKWVIRSDKKSSAYLCLGVYYYFTAWKKRGTKSASDLSRKQIDGFVLYLKKAFEALQKVDGLLYTEAQARLIAVYNGLDERELAKESFNTVTKKYKDNLYAYLHYSEIVLPKWGGSLEEMAQFRQQWPQILWIKNTLEMKEAYDLFMQGEVDYEDGFLKAHIHQLIEKVEQDLIRTPPEGPNLYRIYAYLYLLSIARNNKELEKKYKKLMKNNLTIFPFGIAR